jgi:hypothetical protein
MEDDLKKMGKNGRPPQIIFFKWKTTERKFEDDLKKMEDNPNKNGRLPQKTGR